MSPTKAQFDLIKKDHPELEVKYSKLLKLRESEWEHLYRVDEKFRSLRQSIRMETISRKEKYRITGNHTRWQ